jgi:CheY-like chemotaxis protein
VYAAKHDEVAAGEYVLIAVSDTGVGMTPAVAERALDPFYTTKEIGQGSGLGLSQVFGFVKQSGGHLKIFTELGCGTTVKIFLPRFVGDHAAQHELRSVLPALALTESAEIILVVEDKADVRAYSCDVLTQLGYRVIEAEDARSGLLALGQHPEIQLLFTDVGLPGMNGYAFATEAVRQRPDLRVLFTTGYAGGTMLQDSGFDRDAPLLPKPYNMASLATKVREAIGSAA